MEPIPNPGGSSLRKLPVCRHAPVTRLQSVAHAKGCRGNHFEARLDTAPDALCGSVCRLSSSDTAPPLHAAFPHVPTAHRTCSTGCHDRSGGR